MRRQAVFQELSWELASELGVALQQGLRAHSVNTNQWP